MSHLSQHYWIFIAIPTPNKSIQKKKKCTKKLIKQKFDFSRITRKRKRIFCCFRTLFFLLPFIPFFTSTFLDVFPFSAFSQIRSFHIIFPETFFFSYFIVVSKTFILRFSFFFSINKGFFQKRIDTLDDINYSGEIVLWKIEIFILSTLPFYIISHSYFFFLQFFPKRRI